MWDDVGDVDGLLQSVGHALLAHPAHGLLLLLGFQLEAHWSPQDVGGIVSTELGCVVDLDARGIRHARPLLGVVPMSLYKKCNAT